jgi:rod shape-determining protein MreC
MSFRNFSFLVAVSLILLFLIFFAPLVGWKLHALLGPRGIATEDAASLTAQNEVLAAELAQVKSMTVQMPNVASNTIRAMAYSRYPLNFKDQILVNAGTNQGVALGKAVLFQGVLVGIVQKIFPDDALVTTIFDPTFKMPVRVGNAGVDALLQGGANPQAVSIAKNAKIGIGDIVVAAGPGVPYGIPIARVAGIAASSNDLFNQATLDFAYDINTIETVAIEK